MLTCTSLILEGLGRGGGRRRRGGGRGGGREGGRGEEEESRGCGRRPRFGRQRA
jgi:hypothetical protein